MKISLAAILCNFAFSCSYGQEKTKQEVFEPFKILIVKPDSAVIPDSLKVYADHIEKKHSSFYYSAIKNLEQFGKNMSGREGKRKNEMEILAMKAREKEFLDFRYFHSVAEKTLFELRLLFNRNSIESDYTLDNPILEGELIDGSKLISTDLKELGRRYQANYIVTFENIRVFRKEGVLTLSYVTSVFWKKENKMILRKEIEGNAPVDNFKFLSEISPPGNRHEGIDCDNYLECMIMSAVRFSSEELFLVISNLQRR